MNINWLVSSSQTAFEKLRDRNFEKLSDKKRRHYAALVHQHPEVMHTQNKQFADLTGTGIILNE